MTVRHITEAVAVDLAELGVRAVDGWWDQHGGFGPNDDPDYCEPRETDGEYPDDEARECFHSKGRE